MCDINFVFLFRLKDFWVVNAYTIGRFLTAVSNVWIKINKQCLLSASLALVSKYKFLSFITNISCRKLYIVLVARENGAPYALCVHRSQWSTWKSRPSGWSSTLSDLPLSSILCSWRSIGSPSTSLIPLATKIYHILNLCNNHNYLY